MREGRILRARYVFLYLKIPFSSRMLIFISKFDRALKRQRINIHPPKQ